MDDLDFETEPYFEPSTRPWPNLPWHVKAWVTLRHMAPWSVYILLNDHNDLWINFNEVRKRIAMHERKHRICVHDFQYGDTPEKWCWKCDTNKTELEGE